MDTESLILEIPDTPYLIETNLLQLGYSWAELQIPEKARNVYATIWKCENGSRPIWQIEFRGATAITDAVLSVANVVGEPIVHKLRKVGA